MEQAKNVLKYEFVANIRTWLINKRTSELLFCTSLGFFAANHSGYGLRKQIDQKNQR